LAKEKQKELAAKKARQMVKMAAKAKKAREQQAEQQQKWAEAQKQAAERKKVEKQAGEEADRFTAVWCSADRKRGGKSEFVQSMSHTYISPLPFAISFTPSIGVERSPPERGVGSF
jgi:hypothetical protein